MISVLVAALCADYSARGKAISGQSFGAAKDMTHLEYISFAPPKLQIIA